MVTVVPLIPTLNPYGSYIVMGGQHWNHRDPWEPFGYLEIITFPGLFQFYLGAPHIRIYFYSYRILPTWDLYGSYIGKKKPILGPFRTLMG